MKRYKIPKCYQVLEHIIDLKIPEFENSCKEICTLSLSDKTSEQQYLEFIQKIEKSVGNHFFPIVRLCDGEYIYMVGRNIASSRLNLYSRLFVNLKEYIKIILRYDYKSAGGTLYKSGTYNFIERQKYIKNYLENLNWISKKGILAMHFSWGKIPFTEGLWPSLKKLFDKNEIQLTIDNYIPFYFVYAYLASNKSDFIFNQKRILVINSASGLKKDRIIKSILNRNAAKVEWISISTDRSMFDKIDITPYQNHIDIVLIGAGVGKLNIIKQLENMNAPCIDIGFYIEILADEKRKFERTLCCTDLELKKFNEKR
jgi:hypothetical protein